MKILLDGWHYKNPSPAALAPLCFHVRFQLAARLARARRVVSSIKQLLKQHLEEQP